MHGPDCHQSSSSLSSWDQNQEGYGDYPLCPGLLRTGAPPRYYVRGQTYMYLNRFPTSVAPCEETAQQLLGYCECARVGEGLSLCQPVRNVCIALYRLEPLGLLIPLH